MAQARTQQKVEYLGASRALPNGCPLEQPPTLTALHAALQESAALSVRIRDHIQERPDAAGWLRNSVDTARPMLKPWAMEIVFLTGALGEARFKDLETGLGISSKVLATRLRELTSLAQLERTVEPTTPVQIVYRLTKQGRATAALATPLFAHLNLCTAD